jgi:hypothetical protein
MLRRIALAVALMAVLVVAGTAFAGNGAGSNKSPSSWISAPRVVSSGSPSLAAASTAPRYGDGVTFTASTNQTSNPFVNLLCYQNGTLVYNGWSASLAGGSGDETFGLGSPAWQSGAADCTANLDMYWNGKWKVLASSSFHVDA